jgi:hypothetical protein
MKTMTIVSLLILGVGVWLEYQKDSSFASVDSGSLIIGAGAGMLLGHLV